MPLIIGNKNIKYILLNKTVIIYFSAQISRSIN